jgi:hypothetical protein
MNYDQILGTFAESTGHINVYRTGYKYSLPRGLQVDKSSLYNETITSGHNTYYLYVDVVSYHNKKNYNYEFNPNSYYSKSFNFNDKSGFVEINLKDNNQYLIEIMYNYAKIEVMVDKKDINTSLLYAISILKNISYNDSVIEKLLGKDIFNYSEEDYNIFNTTSNDSNYLNVDNSYQGVDEQEEVYDSDLIN